MKYSTRHLLQNCTYPVLFLQTPSMYMSSSRTFETLYFYLVYFPNTGRVYYQRDDPRESNW